MIEIVNAYTRSGNEWCTCCQKQTNTKRIKFSYDGRQGNSVVLCDDCRRELAQVIGAIPIPKRATNGDVIEAIFPNCEQKEHINNGYFEMYFDNDLRNASYMRVSKEWWNAQYKKEVEE